MTDYRTHEGAVRDAIRILESAGIKPDDELDWILSPEIHEETALAHLRAAKWLRAREAKGRDD